jgi:SAM-dependent methyltransferase
LNASSAGTPGLTGGPPALPACLVRHDSIVSGAVELTGNAGASKGRRAGWYTRRMLQRIAALALTAALAVSGAEPVLARGAGQSAPAAPARKPDIGWGPTMPEVADAMLRVARVHAGDVVYDLGCGDGRILIAAAKQYGARGVGIEIDPAYVKIAREKVRAEGLADRIRIVQQDLFLADLRPATVVMLYLGPAVMAKLRPKLLRELRPGTRVVSHAFDFGEDWKPDYAAAVPNTAMPDLPDVNVFYWVIP